MTLICHLLICIFMPKSWVSRLSSHFSVKVFFLLKKVLCQLACFALKEGLWTAGLLCSHKKRNTAGTGNEGKQLAKSRSSWVMTGVMSCRYWSLFGGCPSTSYKSTNGWTWLVTEYQQEQSLVFLLPPKASLRIEWICPHRVASVSHSYANFFFFFRNYRMVL